MKKAGRGGMNKYMIYFASFILFIYVFVLFFTAVYEK